MDRLADAINDMLRHAEREAGREGMTDDDVAEGRRVVGVDRPPMGELLERARLVDRLRRSAPDQRVAGKAIGERVDRAVLRPVDERDMSERTLDAGLLDLPVAQ